MRHFIAIAILATTVSSFAPPPPAVLPDAGSSALLMALGVAGIGLVARFFAQKRG